MGIKRLSGLAASLYFSNIAWTADNTYEQLQISGNSMAPIIKHGSTVQILRDYYSAHPPQRGDIVAFRCCRQKKPLIKSVLGVPGDTLELKWNQDCQGWHIILNQRLLTNQAGERFCLASGHEKMLLKATKFHSGTIPVGLYLVLGEPPRGGMTDSTSFGLLEKSRIIGKILTSTLERPEKKTDKDKDNLDEGI